MDVFNLNAVLVYANEVMRGLICFVYAVHATCLVMLLILVCSVNNNRYASGLVVNYNGPKASTGIIKF